MATDAITKYTGKRGTSWQVRVDLGPDPVTGKRRQRMKTVKTEREAKILLAEWRTEIERGIVVDPSKLTIAEYLQQWITTVGPNVRFTTLERENTVVTKYIIPTLGAVPVQKLTAIQLQAFYNGLLHRGASVHTAHYAHIVLFQALKQAERMHIVVRNVAADVTPPRYKRPQVVVWTSDEVARFMALAVQDTTYGPIFQVAILSGLRRGELLSLRWADLDLEHGVIRVRRTMAVTTGGIEEHEPKTTAGRRSVILSRTGVQVLREHRVRQMQQRLKTRTWEDHDLVFCSDRGTIINPPNLYRTFNSLIDKAGVSKVTFHALRHIHATLLLKDGHNIRAIQDRLGHSDVSITLGIYGHVLEGMDRTLADGIDAILSRSVAPRDTDLTTKAAVQSPTD